MPPGVEALAGAALVAIAADDEVLGTGFVIDGDGTVLTCHHVVAGQSSLRLHGPDGTVRDAGEADILAAPEIDLALIRVAAPFGRPLPLVSDAHATTRYWSKGYHRLSGAVRAAFPVQGAIIGRTSIAYAAGWADYLVDDVFVLRDDSIDAGLSGAPVLDPDAGVVVAVVSTKFTSGSWSGGFAVPIGHAAGHAALRAAIERNQASVPAFGAYLNAPAARAVCAEVTESELDHLIQLRGVDLGRRVPRTAIESAMASFLDGDSPMLALVGPSGVGKSTEIAALARRLPGRALLLRGSSLSRDSAAGAGSAIRAAVSGRPGQRPLPDDVDERLAHALAPEGGLIVLLDALNEAPFSGRAFEEWIAGTRSWLRGTAGRLVVSCRSELWGDLVGRALAAPLGGQEPTVISLAGFDDDEYRAALAVYGNVTGSDSPVLRLPLVLGLWSRYQAAARAAPDGTISLNRAIEAYVGEAARSLAVKGTGPPLSAHVMQSRLVAVAELMWKRDSDTVDLTSLSQVLGNVDDLVAEGVMAATPSGYRFVYDDVGDWLQARTLDLDRALDAVSSDENSSWRRVGPIAAALRDVERSQGHQALGDRLSRLVEGAGNSDRAAFRVAEDTLTKLADAAPYAGTLQLMANLILSPAALSRPLTGLSPVSPGQVEFWRSVPLPLPARLDLLRQLCRLDSYRRWRPKDWAGNRTWPVPGFGLNSYSALALVLVRQDPSAGITALVPWLRDQSPLHGDEAVVAHVAMGILYDLRYAHEDLVRQVMTGAPQWCEDLFGTLAADDPEFIARLMLALPDAKDADQLAIYAARLVLNRKLLAGDLRQAVYAAIAGRYERGVAPSRQGAFLKVLLEGPDGPAYVLAVIDAYRAGVPEVDEWTLATAARFDDSGAVAPDLAAALDGLGERRERALAALANARNPGVWAFADHAVRLHLEHGGPVDLHVGRYVEDRLLFGHVASGNLLAIIMLIIGAPAAPARDALMYTLTSSKFLHDPAQRLALMRELIGASESRDSLVDIVQALAESTADEDRGFDTPTLLSLLELALARLDPDTADRTLFGQAYGFNQEFAALLGDWLTAGQLTPPGEYTGRFLAFLESGDDPESATRKVWEIEAAKHRRGGRERPP